VSNRHAAITTFLPGVWPRRITQAHCRALGESLARLHLAGTDYPPQRANAIGPHAWQPLLEKCRAGADDVQRGLFAELMAAAEAIVSHWPGGLPHGHIHADLFPDNVFFLDGRLSGLIDFYFACTDFLAYDIAVCLNAWCFEVDGAFNATRARALLGGYTAIRKLTDAEQAALPVLAQGAALRFLLTRLYDWLNTPSGAFVTPKNPLDYLRRLRFHLGTRDFHAYGL
jgi:homoserine kinase type II